MHSRTFLLIGLFLAGGFAIACEGTLDGPTSPTSVDSSAPPSSINGATRSPLPSPQPPPGPPPGSPSSGCDASKAQFVIAVPATSEVLEQARVAAQAESARFLRPDELITTEYLPSRLNLRLDQRNRVASEYCG